MALVARGSGSPAAGEAPPVTVVALPLPGLLRLLQLASPALPIGAFAYSQGLEAAVEQRSIHDEVTAAEFLGGVLSDGMAHLELPYLLRLYRAFAVGDAPAAERFSAELFASRETAERRLEDQHLGRSLARLLLDQGLLEAEPWCRSEVVTHAALFALAGARFGVPEDALAPGFAFSWLESQVSALTRLVPLGQLAAQRVLSAVAARIPAAVELAQSLSDAELGATLPGLALASAWHETQYSRLFRS
jgi:urease accessory protein